MSRLPENLDCLRRSEMPTLSSTAANGSFATTSAPRGGRVVDT